MVRLRKMIKWVVLIQIWIFQMFWLLSDKANTWLKTHFYILGSTNCDTKTLIWLSTKINKFYYLGFCSSDLKSNEISEKISIRRIHGENPIFIFWVLYLYNSLWLFIFPRARLRPVTPEKFMKHGFSFFHQILPFYFESWLMCYFSCVI